MVYVMHFNLLYTFHLIVDYILEHMRHEHGRFFFHQYQMFGSMKYLEQQRLQPAISSLDLSLTGSSIN